MYGGGQFELGPGRGQIQLLASLYHPDTPNDVSPSGFHVADPPPGLPESPLAAAGARARLPLGLSETQDIGARCVACRYAPRSSSSPSC